MTQLDRARIERLLNAMARIAHSRDVYIDMFIVGGGAMALVYDRSRRTGDLGALFQPTRIAYEFAPPAPGV